MGRGQSEERPDDLTLVAAPPRYTLPLLRNTQELTFEPEGFRNAWYSKYTLYQSASNPLVRLRPTGPIHSSLTFSVHPAGTETLLALRWGGYNIGEGPVQYCALNDPVCPQPECIHARLYRFVEAHDLLLGRPMLDEQAERMVGRTEDGRFTIHNGAWGARHFVHLGDGIVVSVLAFGASGVPAPEMVHVCRIADGRCIAGSCLNGVYGSLIDILALPARLDAVTELAARIQLVRDDDPASWRAASVLAPPLPLVGADLSLQLRSVAGHYRLDPDLTSDRGSVDHAYWLYATSPGLSLAPLAQLWPYYACQVCLPLTPATQHECVRHPTLRAFASRLQERFANDFLAG